ncbi:hypothetical protein Tco_0282422 [Tanacetum coccineum]
MEIVLNSELNSLALANTYSLNSCSFDVHDLISNNLESTFTSLCWTPSLFLAMLSTLEESFVTCFIVGTDKCGTTAFERAAFQEGNNFFSGILSILSHMDSGIVSVSSVSSMLRRPVCTTSSPMPLGSTGDLFIFAFDKTMSSLMLLASMSLALCNKAVFSSFLLLPSESYGPL